MRVLQIISQTFIGGAESFAYSICAELARRDHQVLLLANRLNGPLFEKPRPPGMEVRVLDRHSRLDPKIVPFIAGAIREFRPDVFHSHNFETNTWARTIACFFPNLPVVCHEHSGKKARQSFDRIWMDRLLYPRASAAIVCTPQLEQLMHERYHVPKERLHYLPNGIEVDLYTPDGTVERDPMGVVCVAALTPVKNHAGLLRAWRTVVSSHPRARLTLVGEGELKAKIVEQVRTLGLVENVILTGMQRDVRPYLWGAGTFVLFSHTEGGPISLLEAMAAELACVAPAVGEIPSMLGDGAAGRLVPLEDEAALARTLMDLLESPGERASIARRGREDVVAKYSVGRCVDVIERIYSEVIKR
jgi:glycosyltransferase involved in cell wall biosynthesis